MPNAPLKPQIVFRAGTHTSADGTKHVITAADLVQCAAAYDPAVRPAPLVVGHPRIEDPAYGWVEMVVAQGDTLAIAPERVEAAFADMVNEGRYPNRSACFYPPTAKSNPKPGTWYLKHVGFLGAHPPAVAGLPPIRFAADDGDTVAFTVSAAGETVAFAETSETDSRLLRLFRSLRDLLIERFGTDAADRVVPTWEVDGLADQAAVARVKEEAAPFAAAPVTEKEKPMSDETEALKAALVERDKKLAAFAAEAAKRRADDDKAFVTAQVAAAKVPASLSTGLVAFMAGLDDTESVAFGEATQTPRDFFKGFVAALPAAVAFGEMAGGGETGDGTGEAAAFAAPPGWSVASDRLALDAKITALMAANPGLDYLEAARRCGA